MPSQYKSREEDPKHVSIKLENGFWQSKCGMNQKMGAVTDYGHDHGGE